MNNDHWPVRDQATAEPKYGFTEFSGPGDPHPYWTTAGLQVPESLDADPTADWPVPYSLTPVAEALMDAEAGS